MRKKHEDVDDVLKIIIYDELNRRVRSGRKFRWTKYIQCCTCQRLTQSLKQTRKFYNQRGREIIIFPLGTTSSSGCAAPETCSAAFCEVN